jgi:hypothetical protein
VLVNLLVLLDREGSGVRSSVMELRNRVLLNLQCWFGCDFRYWWCGGGGASDSFSSVLMAMRMAMGSPIWSWTLCSGVISVSLPAGRFCSVPAAVVLSSFSVLGVWCGDAVVATVGCCWGCGRVEVMARCGVARWGVAGVLFGFGGGAVPTTFAAAHGGDGVKMWLWWEFGVCVLGWWGLAELVGGLFLRCSGSGGGGGGGLRCCPGAPERVGYVDSPC